MHASEPTPLVCSTAPRQPPDDSVTADQRPALRAAPEPPGRGAATASLLTATTRLEPRPPLVCATPPPVADQGGDGVARRAHAAATGCGPDSDETRQSRGWSAHSAQPERRRVERGQTYGPGSSHQCTVRSGQWAGSGRVCEGVVDREPSQRAIRERPLLKRPCRGRVDKGARLPR
jgi:hypothetical protein